MKEDTKHADKFGYASVQVGDGAALFTQHFQEYGPHYGRAAQTVGASLAVDGCAHQTLLEGREFFQWARIAIPLVAGSAVMAATATALGPIRSFRDPGAAPMATTQGRSALERADHLLRLTGSDALDAVLRTAELYRNEEHAQVVHLVVSDSYQSAQLRLKLPAFYTNNQRINSVLVFDTLQEALTAASTESTIHDDTTRVLIYFHTLEPLVLPQDLQVENCPDFILRSDAGGAGLRPRLILNGKLRAIASTGTIRAVAVCGGVSRDETAQIRFVNCTTSAEDPRNFSDPGAPSRKRRRKRRAMAAGLLTAAPVMLAIAVLLFPTTDRKDEASST